MKTINAATDLFESIEVDLWGTKFSVRQPTRAFEKKINDLIESLGDVPEGDDSVQLEHYCDILNIVLEPIPDENGKKTQAKTVLKKLYAEEAIGVAHVSALLDRISEYRAERPN